jgi:hypothetical protein
MSPTKKNKVCPLTLREWSKDYLARMFYGKLHIQPALLLLDQQTRVPFQRLAKSFQNTIDSIDIFSELR